MNSLPIAQHRMGSFALALGQRSSRSDSQASESGWGHTHWQPGRLYIKRSPAGTNESVYFHHAPPDAHLPTPSSCMLNQGVPHKGPARDLVFLCSPLFTCVFKPPRPTTIALGLGMGLWNKI